MKKNRAYLPLAKMLNSSYHVLHRTIACMSTFSINSVLSILNRIVNATHLNPRSPEKCPIIFFTFKVHVHVYIYAHFDAYTLSVVAKEIKSTYGADASVVVQ